MGANLCQAHLTLPLPVRDRTNRFSPRVSFNVTKVPIRGDPPDGRGVGEGCGGWVDDSKASDSRRSKSGTRDPLSFGFDGFLLSNLGFPLGTGVPSGG